jgi:hypothetical protein
MSNDHISYMKMQLEIQTATTGHVLHGDRDRGFWLVESSSSMVQQIMQAPVQWLLDYSGRTSLTPPGGRCRVR